MLSLTDLKKVLPDRGHRAQVLHLAVATGVRKVLYSIVSPTEHLHSVLIEFPAELCDAWSSALEHINTEWGTHISPELDRWGTAVDYNTVALYQPCKYCLGG